MTVTKDLHPLGKYLRMDRMPHIWCPGCGIGVALNAFVQVLDAQQYNTKKMAVVSGIGCTGRTAGYVNMDSFHTTHGRAIPFATGLKLTRPELEVVVFSGDGDIAAIGGNHFIHAARRNMDLLVICVNNYIYGMTGGQMGPTTPEEAFATTAPFGNWEKPFNLVSLAESCGAAYVARWTTYHARQLQKSFKEALGKRGFRFIEVMSPCPTYYERRNRLGDTLTRMQFYKERTKTEHGADTRDAGVGFEKDFIVGKFVDIERPTYIDAKEEHLKQKLGDKYKSGGGGS